MCRGVSNSEPPEKKRLLAIGFGVQTLTFDVDFGTKPQKGLN